MEDDVKETLKLNIVKSYFGDEATDEYSAAWNYAMVEVSYIEISNKHNINVLRDILCQRVISSTLIIFQLK